MWIVISYNFEDDSIELSQEFSTALEAARHADTILADMLFSVRRPEEEEWPIVVKVTHRTVAINKRMAEYDEYSKVWFDPVSGDAVDGPGELAAYVIRKVVEA